jgi:hypothetical protein
MMFQLQRYTLILGAAFVLTAVFGLFAMVLSAHDHQSGCHGEASASVVCEEVLAHIPHWQQVALAVAVEVLVLVAFAYVFFVRIAYGAAGNHVSAYARLRQRVPLCPTLFQELFARGILNRKEPLLTP